MSTGDEPLTRLLHQLCDDRFASRLFAQDVTLWGPHAEADAATRLGWVRPFAAADRVMREAEELRDRLRAQGVDRIVLCGMGGSSLGPEVVARAAGVSLTILDSTHPAEVERHLERDLSRTAVVISSKSGSTVETLSHAAAFQRAFESASIDPVTRMIFVTDPNSDLAARAEEGYRVFAADPTIGGRFSVLSAFGIVPTVLAGADIRPVLADAQLAAEQLSRDTVTNPGLRLAAELARGLPDQNILLFAEHPTRQWGLGDWVEQLLAESTGKQGRGILPISVDDTAHELVSPPAHAVVVRTAAAHTQLPTATSAQLGQRSISIHASLGAQFMLWEVATAAVGHVIDINPFDQPDVEAAKIAARDALDRAPEAAAVLQLENEQLEAPLVTEIETHLSPAGYLVIQAFVDRDDPFADRVRRLRTMLAQRLEVPVSLCWGPRYLHSVGQFHKGGPALGVFLQLIDLTDHEYPIPGSVNGFGALMRAQAQGDREVLTARGRPVIVRSR